MVRDTQDNEPNPWSAIGLQTALIVNKLRNHAQLSNLTEEKKETDSDDRSSGNDEEKRAFERLEFMNTRLRELSRFEDAARGKRNKFGSRT